MEVGNNVVGWGPILLSFIVAVGFVVVTMIATHLLGPKIKSKRKLEVFECGIESIENARMPMSVHYFLVAILFVLFDVEIIFMYPWAVNFTELGALGLIEMMTYVSLMMTGFFYIMKRGGFDWQY